MNREEVLSVLANLLMDNAGNRITASLATGIIASLGQAIGKEDAGKSKDTG